MATIEERAKEHYPIGIGIFTKEGAEFLQKAYTKGATEQDRIAREEERERCINIIKSVICASCINNKHIDICSVTLCRAKEIINAIERR